MDKKIIPSVVLIALAILMIPSGLFMKLEHFSFARFTVLTGIVCEVAGVLWLFSQLKKFYYHAH